MIIQGILRLINMLNDYPPTHKISILGTLVGDNSSVTWNNYFDNCTVIQVSIPSHLVEHEIVDTFGTLPMRLVMVMSSSIQQN